MSVNAYKIIDFDQSSQDWKKWRREYIGSSDAPVIQEVSPWKTLLQLWEEKIEGKEQRETVPMARGKALEAKARSKVNEMYYAAYVPICMHSLKQDCMTASLDGWDESQDIPGVEIKCPRSKEIHIEALNGIIPDHYYAQLQHQMYVSDSKEWRYVSFYDGSGELETDPYGFPTMNVPEIAQIIVERDDTYCKTMIEREKRFFESLLNFDPPEPTDRDIVKINNPTALQISKRYREISRKLKEVEAEEALLRKTLVTFADHPRVIIGDVRVTKVLRKGNVKYDNIPELVGVDLDRYRGKPIESWRISAL